MKLLIVNTVPFQLNGITSVIMNYYRKLDKSGLQIDFVALSGISDPLLQELEAGGSRVFCLPRKGNPLSYLWRLTRLLRAGRYDALHVHGNSATMALDLLPGVLAGVPMRIAHSHNTTCTHMRAHKLLSPLFQKCCTHALACGDAAGKWLFGSRPFQVLNNGIDLASYRYDETTRLSFRQRIGAEDKLVIGHVGNFVEQKNHDFLLRWFARLAEKRPDAQLLLIGEGELLAQSRQTARELGIIEQVVFLGKSTEVASWLQAMDVFVLPSLHEGLPVVLVEAQAAGLSCFAADTVTAEADLTGTVRFLPITDPGCWAAALQDFAPGDREHASEVYRQRIRARGYDVAENARWLRTFYERRGSV